MINIKFIAVNFCVLADNLLRPCPPLAFKSPPRIHYARTPTIFQVIQNSHFLNVKQGLFGKWTQVDRLRNGLSEPPGVPHPVRYGEWHGESGADPAGPALYLALVFTRCTTGRGPAGRALVECGN